MERITVNAWERLGLWVLVFVVLGFGVLTVHRSANLSRRMGDSRMLFRAAWMVRSGGDLYAEQEEYDLHYNYPPLLACLMLPLADPPEGTNALAIPYPALVAIWYTFNAFCILSGIHLFARGLAPHDPVDSRPWWGLRLVPFLICLPAIGSTVMQGQVTPLLLFLVAASFALAVRYASLASGFCVGFAACVKLFPALLIVWPAWQRDHRSLAGVALACLVGLGLVPLFVMGPTKTTEAYVTLGNAMIAPALGLGDDESRTDELFHASGPHSMSLQTAVNNLIYLDRTSRPAKPSPLARLIALAIGGTLLLITLWQLRPTGSLSDAGERVRQGLAYASLSLVMLLVCPVTHLHYLMFTLPAIAALMAVYRAERAWPPLWLMLVFLLHTGSVVLTQLPGLEELKDQCFPTLGLIMLWGVVCHGCTRLHERFPAPQPIPVSPPRLLAA